MLRQRVITALALAPLVLLVILWAPHELTAMVFALLAFAAFWEWSAFPGFRRRSVRGLYVTALCACILAVWWIGVDRPALDGVLYAAIAWWVVALVWIVAAPAFMNQATAAVAGALVLVPAWLALTRLHAHDPQLLLFLLALVAAADVGAYFAGRRYGRKKLAPRVSPGKTWAGVFGGLGSAVLVSVFGVWWLQKTAALFVGLCVLVVAASIVGDLTESL
ncbi:MAG TPA: phosphatidate cytidylyltransferase, partial [Steroidobacter sp.]|nr:phosphatidate cytidylyltransferase [Steroidobacter sp.]